ncbi:MAG: hypothetical protein R3C27_12630 [Hyphomonadaceae bacterium]
MPAPTTLAEINDQGAWTSPDGVLSLTVPADWAPAEDASAGATRLLTVASQTQIVGRQTLRQCSVERAVTPNGQAQQQVNAMTESSTAESVLGPASGSNPVHSFSNEIVNGVRVISFDRNTGNLRHMQSVFAIADGRELVRYTVACGAGEGENADVDIAAMIQFMSSLAINARTAP